MVFDREHLRTMCDDDAAFEREVVGSFLDSAAALVAQMAGAVQAADRKAIRAAAHGLKGSSRSIGAPELGDACAALEGSISDDDLAASRAAVDRVRHEYQRLEKALVAHLEGRDEAA